MENPEVGKCIWREKYPLKYHWRSDNLEPIDSLHLPFDRSSGSGCIKRLQFPAIDTSRYSTMDGVMEECDVITADEDIMANDDIKFYAIDID